MPAAYDGNPSIRGHQVESDVTSDPSRAASARREWFALNDNFRCQELTVNCSEALDIPSCASFQQHQSRGLSLQDSGHQSAISPIRQRPIQLHHGGLELVCLTASWAEKVSGLSISDSLDKLITIAGQTIAARQKPSLRNHAGSLACALVRVSYSCVTDEVQGWPPAGFTLYSAQECRKPNYQM